MNSTRTFYNKESSRLDLILASLLNESRNQVEVLIAKGRVKIDGNLAKKGGIKLKGGEQICIEIPEILHEESMLEIDFDVEILYEDSDILVLNKPANVVVHSAPSVKESTLVDWLKSKNISLSTLSGEERHGIVHRLDKETSGAIVVAKNNDTHKNLSLQLERREIGRYYIAIVDLPLKDDVIVESKLGRNPYNRLKISAVSHGRYAKSAFCKLVESKKCELIAAKLFTGRTHQIRAHLESFGRHILHDELYGYRGASDGRIFLHAYLLYLKHPRTGELMLFQAPIFKDMLRYLEQNFQMERVNEALCPEFITERFAPFRLLDESEFQRQGVCR
ncbi:MAG: RluA family pseudouridine synthase [Wolinella sp.]